MSNQQEPEREDARDVVEAGYEYDLEDGDREAEEIGDQAGYEDAEEEYEDANPEDGGVPVNIIFGPARLAHVHLRALPREGEAIQVAINNGPDHGVWRITQVRHCLHLNALGGATKDQTHTIVQVAPLDGPASWIAAMLQISFGDPERECWRDPALPQPDSVSGLTFSSQDMAQNAASFFGTMPSVLPDEETPGPQ